MEDTVECPKCGHENAYFEIADANGVYYYCPDCDNEWCDSSIKADEEYVEVIQQSLDTRISEQMLRSLFSSSQQYSDMIINKEEAKNSDRGNIIPLMGHVDLSELFKNKLKVLLSKIKKENTDLYNETLVSLKDLKKILGSLIDIDIDKLDYKNSMLIDEVESFFKTELIILRKYTKDLNNYQQGTFDNLISESKELNLSKIDTIVYILKSYFKVLM